MDPVRRWRLPAPETRTHTEVAQAPRSTGNAKHSTRSTRLQSPRPCSTLWPEKSACDQATALSHGPVQGACTSKAGDSNPQRQSTLRTTLCKIPKLAKYLRRAGAHRGPKPVKATKRSIVLAWRNLYAHQVQPGHSIGTASMHSTTCRDPVAVSELMKAAMR
jgi:hypothetical protein